MKVLGPYGLETLFVDVDRDELAEHMVKGVVMTRMARLTVLILVLASLNGTLGGDLGGRAAAAPAEPVRLAAEPTALYPDGTTMSIGIYSTSNANFEVVAEAGFTVDGPHYNDSPELFSARVADRDLWGKGVRYAYKLTPHPDLVGVPIIDRPAAIAALSDGEIVSHISSLLTPVLEDANLDPLVAVWELGIEEARFWLDDEMRYLQVASDAVRELDPSDRPVRMYEPNNRVVEALLPTGAFQDVTYMGAFATLEPIASRGARIAWAMEHIVNAAALLETVPQAVFQLSIDFPGMESPLTGPEQDFIETWIRHDVYLGLIKGIKGFQVWSGFDNRPGLTTYREQLDAYGTVATDLTGTQNLQEPFLFGEQQSDATLTQTSGPTTVSWVDYAGDMKTIDAVNMLETVTGSDRYVFIVNSAPTAVDIEVSGLPSGANYAALFDHPVPAINGDSFTVQLAAGEVYGLRLWQSSPLVTAGAQAFERAERLRSIGSDIAASMATGLWTSLLGISELSVGSR